MARRRRAIDRRISAQFVHLLSTLILRSGCSRIIASQLLPPSYCQFVVVLFHEKTRFCVTLFSRALFSSHSLHSHATTHLARFGRHVFFMVFPLFFFSRSLYCFYLATNGFDTSWAGSEILTIIMSSSTFICKQEVFHESCLFPTNYTNLLTTILFITLHIIHNTSQCICTFALLMLRAFVRTRDLSSSHLSIRKNV